MARTQLSRRAAQARADAIEDETGAAARLMFRATAGSLGETPERIEAILAGPDAEFILVKFRSSFEPIVRRAVDRGVAIGRRS